MAVISARKVWDGRSGKLTETLQRDRVQRWEVVTDAITDDDLVILQSPLLPRLFDPHSSADPGCLARDIDPQQDDDNPYRWSVTIRYSTAGEAPTSLADGVRPGVPTPAGGGPGGGGQGGGGGQEQKPEDKPAEVSWDQETITVPIRFAFKDRSAAADPAAERSTPILNSAGDPYDPLPEEDAQVEVLTITRWEKTIDNDKLRRYAGATNSKVFAGGAEGAALMMPIKRRRQYENGQFLWQVTYQIKFAPPHIPWLWDHRLVDQGFRELKDGKRIPIWKNGQQVTAPELLDGAGRPLPDSEVSKGVFSQRFYTRRRMDFGPLNLEGV